MGDRIGLSKIVIDSAKQLYKQVEDEKLLKGRPQEAVQAACIYIGCQEHHVSRTFKEITALTKVAKKEIARCYKGMYLVFLERHSWFLLEKEGKKKKWEQPRETTLATATASDAVAHL